MLELEEWGKMVHQAWDYPLFSEESEENIGDFNSVCIHPSAYHGTPDFTSLEMGRKDDGEERGE